MTARIWRGWTGIECAQLVAADLRDGVVARHAATAGNVSAELFLRPLAGGVELMILSLWESPEAAPATVEENHRLLVARDTVPAVWERVSTPQSVAAAA
ncbi:MAG: hypothetical protein ACXWZP_00290 [Gaiellaceae bacterium]